MGYAAFLSYSHADARWAQWLHHRLETYRVPARLVGTQGPDGPIASRLGTIFRDRDELPTAGDLGTTIRAALADSAALILICSPAAAKSPWVHREIEAFKALGRGDRIACFIVDGKPDATEMESACFPSALTDVGSDGIVREPLAADARPDGDGRERAFIKLVAGLLGVSYDTLARREAQRRQRRLLMLTTASVCGMAVAIALAANAWIARNDAQRRQAQAEDILGFMLGDLRGKLTTVGRLDLMRAVDDKATHYFATLDPRDLSDRSLEAQARSLTGIGSVRLDEGKYAEAMAAFNEAYARSSALYQRQPSNGQRLFDRAQAEYWVGAVYWRKGLFDETRVWFTRYRDSALHLAAMDRKNFDWQREVAYGHQNLATLDQSQGRKKEAEQAFRAELLLYRKWIAQHPRDASLRDEAANAASFLGSLAQDDGRLAEAEMRFREQVEALSRNRAAEPDNAIWKNDWLYARALLAQAQMAQGEFGAAQRNMDETTREADALAAQDRKNVEWQRLTGFCHLKLAMLAMRTDRQRAEREALRAESSLADAHAAQPDDEPAIRSLAADRLLMAELALDNRRPADAATRLAQVDTDMAPAWARKTSDKLRILMAQTRWLDGRTQQALGDAAAAQAAWATAERLLRESQGDPPAFDRLELLAKVLEARNDNAAAAPYLARLHQTGFVPLVPFEQQIAAR